MFVSKSNVSLSMCVTWYKRNHFFRLMAPGASGLPVSSVTFPIQTGVWSHLEITASAGNGNVTARRLPTEDQAATAGIWRWPTALSMVSGLPGQNGVPAPNRVILAWGAGEGIAEIQHQHLEDGFALDKMWTISSATICQIVQRHQQP